jgi:hypothetical protein
MAQSQKTQLYANERLDLPDYQRLQDFTEDDFQLQNVHLLGGGATSWITKGFRVSDGGGVTVDVTVANSALFNTADTATDLAGTFYIADGTLPASETITLTDGGGVALDNYIHVKINRATSSNAQRVFWDPSLNDGEGGEYKEFVNTAEIKEYEFKVTLGGWSTDTEDIPIARVTTFGGSIPVDPITGDPAIYDARNMFFRLGKGDGYGAGWIGTVVYHPVGAPALDDDNFTGVYTGALTSNYQVRVFGNGTPDTFEFSNDGGVTWDDNTGVGYDMTTGYSLLENGIYVSWTASTGHTIGDYWEFTATANAGEGYRFMLADPSVPSPSDFIGGDKEIDNMKEWMDLVMSAIAEIKFGNSESSSWFEPAPSSLSSAGVVMTGGGDISWSVGNQLAFTENLTFMIPNTNYINKVTATTLAALADGSLYHVTLDRTSSATLVPVQETAALFEPTADSYIICRRLGDIVYVGNGALQLEHGETGKLIRPLTDETIRFAGQLTGANPDASRATPDYGTYGGNPVHYIGNTDSLAVAIAKLGYAFTSRVGTETISGDWTFNNTIDASPSLTFDADVTLTFKKDCESVYEDESVVTYEDGSTVAFEMVTGTAPFTVASTTKVANLNADLLDGYNSTIFGSTLDTSGSNIRLIDPAGGVRSTIIVPYATSAGYATTAGDADTLDGFHASAFATAGSIPVHDHSAPEWGGTSLVYSEATDLQIINTLERTPTDSGFKGYNIINRDGVTPNFIDYSEVGLGQRHERWGNYTAPPINYDFVLLNLGPLTIHAPSETYFVTLEFASHYSWTNWRIERYIYMVMPDGAGDWTWQAAGFGNHAGGWFGWSVVMRNLGSPPTSFRQFVINTDYSAGAITLYPYVYWTVTRVA